MAWILMPDELTDEMIAEISSAHPIDGCPIQSKEDFAKMIYAAAVRARPQQEEAR